MLGTLKLPIRSGIFGTRYYTVAGGPYKQRPAGYKGVKLAKEITLACDVNLPIVDFSIPDVAALDKALAEAVAAVLSGSPVYAGCMGGRGRTGLFLAILAKAFGIATPVEYVRSHYYPHAVETDEQYDFVAAYKVPDAVRSQIRRAYYKSWVTLKSNLTALPVVTPQGAVTKG